MTPGEAAEEIIVWAASIQPHRPGPAEIAARALVDMRAAVHAIHVPLQIGISAGSCHGCGGHFPCPTVRAVEAVWNGDAS